jgi:hypothetical protein
MHMMGSLTRCVPTPLGNLLRDDEEGFVAALRGATPEQRAQWLGRKHASAALADMAIRFDRAAALLAMQDIARADGLMRSMPPALTSRATLGAVGWKQRKPNIALLHVQGGHHGATARAYTERFSEARDAWLRLVQSGQLSPYTWLRRFGTDPSVISAWVGGGLLTASAAWGLLADQPDAAVALLKAEGSAADAAVAAVVSEPEMLLWSERLLAAGVAPPRVWFQRHASVASRALEAVRAGSLSVPSYLDLDPRPGRDLMLDLLGCQQATPWDLLRARALTDAEFEAAARAEDWTPQAALRQGPVPEVAATAWIRDGEVDRDSYLRASANTWQPADPLPGEHRRMARAADSVVALLRDARLPEGAAPRRIAFAARLLGVHLGATEATPAVYGGQSAEDCVVCLERLDAVHPPGEVGDLCAHAPSICAPCLLGTVRANPAALCPMPGCRQPITTEDAIRWGATPDEAQAWAVDLNHTKLGASDTWFACPTPSCPGGIPFGTGMQGARFDCNVCLEPAIIRSTRIEWRRDLTKIQRLIAGLKRANGDGEAVVRECYHCGVPTERRSGCSHMTCRTCGQSWDFNAGAYPPRTASGGLQTYVPHAGLLLHAGLFQGQQPGALGVRDLVAVVHGNARRLSIPLQLRPSQPARLLITVA